MSAASLQLVAVGMQNANHKNRYCAEYLPIEFDSNSLQITRNADLCIPLHLSFEMKKDMGINEFYELISDAQIKLLIGTNHNLNIGLGFLSKLNPIKKVNNSFIIKLPFDFLVGHIALISLSYTLSKLIINIDPGKREQIERITGIFEYIYQDIEERKVFATNNIYQKILVISSPCYGEKKSIIDSNYSDYIIDFDRATNKIGIFIESEQEINSLNILFNDKNYGLLDCNIINDNLVYFSFNNLEYNDKNNLSIELVSINNLLISSQIPDLKLQFMETKIINYNFGLLYLYSEIYNNYNFHNFQENIKYNMCNKIVSVPILIKELFNIKVYDFIKENITNELINNAMATNPSISIIRFFDCTISTDVELPNNINIVILENCNVDLTNLSYDVSEIWLINSQVQTNLPFGLQKLRLYGTYDIESMKIPFGCTIEYIGK
jgi:hypothetical protein